MVIKYISNGIKLAQEYKQNPRIPSIKKCAEDEIDISRFREIMIIKQVIEFLVIVIWDTLYIELCSIFDK